MKAVVDLLRINLLSYLILCNKQIVNSFVFPVFQEEKSRMSKQELIPVGRNNKLLEKWYEIRCSNDAAWCQ